MKNSKIIQKTIPFIVATIVALGSGLTIPNPLQADEQSLNEGLDRIAGHLATIQVQSDNNKSIRIGILEFTDLNGEVTNLGRYVAEGLTTRLFGRKGFEIVERRLLRSLLAEKKLQMSGLIRTSEADIPEQLERVDALLTGSFISLGDLVTINARLLETTGGRVLGAASADIINTTKVRMLLGKLVKSVADNPSPESATSSVDQRLVGVWRESDDNREYFYEIRENGFVLYCELEDGHLTDLDTGLISKTLVTYSGGDQENIDSDLTQALRVDSLPDRCE